MTTVLQLSTTTLALDSSRRQWILILPVVVEVFDEQLKNGSILVGQTRSLSGTSLGLLYRELSRVNPNLYDGRKKKDKGDIWLGLCATW